MRLIPRLHMVEVNLEDSRCVDLYIQDVNQEEGLEFAGMFPSKETAKEAGEEILAQDESTCMEAICTSRDTNKMQAPQTKTMAHEEINNRDDKRDDDEVVFVGISQAPASSKGPIERMDEKFIEAYLHDHLVIEETQDGHNSLSLRNSESFQGLKFVAIFDSKNEAVDCGKKILGSPNHVKEIKSIQAKMSLERRRKASKGRRGQAKQKPIVAYDNGKPKRVKRENQFIAGSDFDPGFTIRKRPRQEMVAPSSPVPHTDVSHTEEDISTIEDGDSAAWFSDLDDVCECTSVFSL